MLFAEFAESICTDKAVNAGGKLYIMYLPLITAALFFINAWLKSKLPILIPTAFWAKSPMKSRKTVSFFKTASWDGFIQFKPVVVGLPIFTSTKAFEITAASLTAEL